MKNHVLGVGGIFFKSRDPQKLLAWYEKHLGITRSWEGGVTFGWSQAETAGKKVSHSTLWFPHFFGFVISSTHPGPALILPTNK
jgi:hypothetical protein